MIRRRSLAMAGTLLLALLPAAPLLAFEGKVVEKDGAPVPDAVVSIVGRAGSARTDAQGMFVWVPDPPLPFDVVVVLPGGRSLPPIRVTSYPGEERPLIVEMPPLDAEPVTVTVEAAPHIMAPPAAGATMLTHDDLEQRRPARMADAVENIPGASRVDGANDAVPSLRGLARGRTLMLLDGARITTERRAGVSASFLDPFFLEAIEVSRGPGSVAYGSDALGGVIHARTRMAEPGSPARIRFAGALGTGIPEASAGLEFSRGLESGGYLFQARYRDLDNYDSPEGEVPRSSATDYGFLGRFQHEAGRGRVKAGYQHDRVQDLGVPSTHPTQQVTRPEEESQRFTASYDFDPFASGMLTGVHLFTGTSKQVTQQTLLLVPERVITSDISASDFGLRAQVSGPAWRARAEAGLDLNGRSNLEARVSDSVLGDSRPIQDASRFDAGIYATGEVPLASKWSGSAGLRYDQVVTRASGTPSGDASSDNGTWSGFASVTAGPFAGWSVTGQAARGFRDPTLSDRYYTGISGRGFVTGNPDLEPETSGQYDAAIRFSGNSIRGAAYVYDYRIENLIQRIQTGTDPVTGQDLFAFINASRARWLGAEVELLAETTWGMAIELGAQRSRGEDSRGDPIDDVPAPNATLVLRQQAGARASALARVAVFAKDDRPGPSEIETPSYATLDLGGGWRPGRDLEVRLLVRNVFDRAYPAGPDARAVLAPGRSALLTLVASLRG